MTVSNREMDRLWSRYNPSNIKAGDLVEVNIGSKYRARVVGLDLDIKNKKVHGSVMWFDICSGRLNYSCEYKQNLPHGVYREYCDDQVQYEKPYINIMYNLEKVANTCANYVLAND